MNKELTLLYSLEVISDVYCAVKIIITRIFE